ncbi:restriction endonuclease subunit S [Lactococcus cremoris]|uniref:restriction endonuclease subunit S n=1 Tax=Lactococcus lactis subsp. cremoris TaxID=1359 RepID=UPI00218244A2|nr:restriction endonuclease subunit S [Lactococcus cremoris]MCT0446505.1 restriction endonuclease subunit S [Lactococcus cremoris]MCT0454248.1 restriction endonuclease subunit S [Lactococcus cremoris]UXV66321.1 restriction endonuclease subunit S [Lactococcus cremoris]
MKERLKAPELRFPGFTDDWEERKLGDTETHFTDGNYGESYPSAKDMSDKANGIPFLRGSDFSNGYLDSSNANYIKPEKHAELTSGHIKQDDIVLAVRGSLGTLGYATKENEGWNINSQLAILRTNKSEISGMFLIQYLLGSKGQKEIFSRNTGTALKQLPIKQLKDIPVPVPTLLEQQKIGSFFKKLDDTIDLHQRKLDLLKEQKKGYLQKMFPKNGSKVPELRFAGFADDWEERKFSDFTKLSQGLQIAISDRFTEAGPNKEFYITNEFLNPNNTKKYYIENPSKNVIANKNDILMTRTGNTGKVVTNTKGAFHNNFFKIDYDPQKISKLFLYFLLTSIPIQKEILIRAGTSTIPDLNHKDFYNIKVYLPIFEEQQRIGSFFKQLDDTIALHQRMLDLLKEQKKGFLQKMFV